MFTLSVRLVRINHTKPPPPSQMALQGQVSHEGMPRFIQQCGCPERAWIEALFSWELPLSVFIVYRWIIFLLLFRLSQTKQTIKTEQWGRRESQNPSVNSVGQNMFWGISFLLYYINYPFEMFTMSTNRGKRSIREFIYSGRQSMPLEARAYSPAWSRQLSWTVLLVGKVWGKEGQKDYTAWTALWVQSERPSPCFLKWASLWKGCLTTGTWNTRWTRKLVVRALGWRWRRGVNYAFVSNSKFKMIAPKCGFLFFVFVCF